MKKKQCDHTFGNRTIGGFEGHLSIHPTGKQICLNCGKTFKELLKIEKAKWMKEIEKLIVEEMIIAQKGEQATSRLTSLAMKL